MIKNMKLFLNTWSIGILIILCLQLLGGGIPEDQNTYFYMGYFSVPLLLSFFITFISYRVIKLLRNKPNL